MGEARYGIKLKTEVLNRCHSTAKTPAKLALNLLEFVVPSAKIAEGLSVYGNKQHNLQAMPDNLVLALKGTPLSHSLIIFRMASTCMIFFNEMMEMIHAPA